MPRQKLHGVEQIVGVEFLTDDAHRQTPDEFRLESVLDEVLRGDVLEQLVVHDANWLRAESDLTVPNATRYLFFQLFKCAAHDEQNVPGVNGVAFGFSAPLKFERRLQLC